MDVFKFFQKTNKNKSTWGVTEVKSNFSFVFLKIEDTKKSLWNLLTFSSNKQSQSLNFHDFLNQSNHFWPSKITKELSIMIRFNWSKNRKSSFLIVWLTPWTKFWYVLYFQEFYLLLFQVPCLWRVSYGFWHEPSQNMMENFCSSPPRIDERRKNGQFLFGSYILL